MIKEQRELLFLYIINKEPLYSIAENVVYLPSKLF